MEPRSFKRGQGKGLGIKKGRQTFFDSGDIPGGGNDHARKPEGRREGLKKTDEKGGVLRGTESNLGRRKRLWTKESPRGKGKIQGKVSVSEKALGGERKVVRKIPNTRRDTKRSLDSQRGS